MASYSDVMTALRNADAAGDSAAAQRLAQIAQGMRGQQAPTPAPPTQGVGAIPVGQTETGAPVYRSQEPAPSPAPSFLDKIRGGVEAGLSLASAATTGLAGAIGGGLGAAAGAAKTAITGGVQPAGGVLHAINQAAGEGAQQMTYQPSTATGQEYAQNAGEKLGEGFSALGPLGAEVAGPLTAGIRAARPVAGALAGGAAEAVAPGILQAAQRATGAVKNALTPTISPEVAATGRAAEERGIPVKAGQLLEANKQESPNQGAFNQGLVQAINPEDTASTKLSPAVNAKAMQRSGGIIGDVMNRTDVPLSTLDAKLDAHLQGLKNDIPDVRNANAGWVDDIRAAADDDGTVPGAALQKLDSAISRRERGTQDMQLKDSLSDLRDAIHDSVNVHATPEDAAALQDARMRYAMGKTLEPLIAKHAATGNIPPGEVMGAVTRTADGKRYMALDKGGELGEMAKIGQLIKAAGDTTVAPPGLLAEVAKATGKTAVWLGSKVLGRFTDPASRALARRMVAKGLGETGETANAVKPAAEPGLEQGFEPQAQPRASASPLGDLTPEWGTSPGATPGVASEGVSAQEMYPAAGEPEALAAAPKVIKAGQPASASRQAGQGIPAVSGRPDLPGVMTAGEPAEVGATQATGEAMQSPNAVLARQQQTPPIPVGEATELPGGNPTLPVEKQRGKIPVGQATELAEMPVGKVSIPKSMPVGKATEITPERIEPKAPIDVGEAKELTEADWLHAHGLGAADEARAKEVFKALQHDPDAVHAAQAKYENSPHAFEREITRINSEGEQRATQAQQTASSSQSAAPVDQGNTNKSQAADQPAGADSSGTAGTQSIEQPAPNPGGQAGNGGNTRGAGGAARNDVSVGQVSPEGQALGTDRKGNQYALSMREEHFGADKKSKSLVVEARDPKTGERRGFVDFAVGDDGVLRAENALVAPASRGSGLAELLYRTVRKSGRDIAPGRAQTDAGKGMVASLRASNIINVEK